MDQVPDRHIVNADKKIILERSFPEEVHANNLAEWFCRERVVE